MMAKSNDLEKKRTKVENELEKAQVALEKQKKLVKTKEEELKRINAELVSCLLIENNMTMAELTAMFAGNEQEKEFESTEHESALDLEEANGHVNTIS